MAVRQIIEIDHELCDGCGDCVTACAEGAIQLIDNKATLVRDAYCDGLGACLGDCHAGAISVVEREAEGFDEEAVAAHLAETVGRSPTPARMPVLGSANPGSGTCPGSQTQALNPAIEKKSGDAPVSQLSHWPVQLHLVPSNAPFLEGASLLLAADCVPVAAAGFHERFLHGHELAIACPKLDSNQGLYIDKLVSMIDNAGIRSIHVVVMEVPCCGGLVRLVQQAASRARSSIPVVCTVVATDGSIRRSRLPV